MVMAIRCRSVAWWQVKNCRPSVIHVAVTGAPETLCSRSIPDQEISLNGLNNTCNDCQVSLEADAPYIGRQR